MAEFEPAVEITLRHEGGYVSDPYDAGGETKYGISKRSYPGLNIAALTIDDAKEIYRRDFWHYDQIIDQDVANKVFDLAVNCGIRTATGLLQEAIRDCGIPVVADGLLGPKTITACNNLDPVKLLDALKQRAIAHYNALVVADPLRGRYLEGWIKRALA